MVKPQYYYYQNHGGSSGGGGDSSGTDSSWSNYLIDAYAGTAVGLSHFKWFVGKTMDQGLESFLSVLSGGRDNDGETIDNAGASGSSNTNNSDGDNEYANPGMEPSIGDLTSPKDRGLKVVGVGYGRTGTYSLAIALDMLGFPTLHTQHLYEHSEIFDHLINTIFYKSIESNEIIMGEPDFSLLTKAGYTATMDLPFALYFPQIQQQYPECKFILTVREDSETWFRSWDVLTSSITQPAQHTSYLFTHVKKLEYYMRWLFSVVNSDKQYLLHPFPLPPQNKHNAISSYEGHNQLVRESIPPSHLLEYNVVQGWDPLCHFLEIPDADCPLSQGIPFPKTNSALAVRWQSYSSFIGPLLLTAFILYSVVSFIFARVTGMTIVEWCCLQKSRLVRSASKKVRMMKWKSL
ncbi:hypothetical protein ACHAXH_004073 [Discostella pseudostelligera]